MKQEATARLFSRPASSRKPEVPTEFDLSPVARSGAVISGRYHGLIFGLQCGRPVVAIATPPKIRSFLGEHGLGEWALSPGDAAEFPALWQRFERQRESQSREAHALARRLRSQVWERTDAARERLLEQAGDLPPPERRVRNRLAAALNLGAVDV